MPNALDRTWASLLGGLDDNNEGAITEEDVRAIAAYARHSTFEQAFGGADSSDLADATWANFPAPVDSVPYLRLQTLRSVAAQVYQHYTGHLAEAANLGARYIEGTPEVDGVTQPRQFTVDWSILLESPYNTLWAVSLWRLADGGSWPGALDAWPEDEIYPLGLPTQIASSLARVEGGLNVWGAAANGSATITLNPGDTVVPVLEFLGTYDSTAAVPAGALKAFSLRLGSSGPVQGNWETTPSLGDVADLWALMRGNDMRITAAAGTDLVPTGGSRQSLVVLPTADTLPTTGNYNGRFYWDEQTGKLHVWKDTAWLAYSPDA